MTAESGFPRHAVVVGISADIGREVALRLLADGWQVTGTFRDPAHVQELRGRAGLELLACDLADPTAIAAAVAQLRAQATSWDLLFIAAGSMMPIGPFFDLDFDQWQAGFDLNVMAQLRFLHGIHALRRPGLAHVALLAGGGTNGTFTNYSAYCLSKISLIKICELLDDECPDLNAFIIGPGFVRTKIHAETLEAGDQAGTGLEKTRNFLATSPGTSFDDIYGHLVWCIESGRAIAGGRNHSTVHDPWRDGGATLRQRLSGDGQMFKLRRSGNF